MGKVFLHDQSEGVIGIRGANARLTVCCPSGSTATATLGDTQYSVVVGDDGQAIFTGLSHGVWTITITKGYQSTTQSVEIVTDYDTVVNIFTATMNIEYPEGSRCTAFIGDDIYSAPDRTGVWTFTVPYTGIWTVECTDGYQTASRSVEINVDNQCVDVVVAYFKALINVTYPPGAICTVTNDIISISASDTTGYWTFEIPSTGTWKVYATDGIQTKDEEIVIMRDLQEENVEFKFFKAIVDITYPVGAKCTVTDGSTTLEAPDTSGKWVANLPWTNEWYILVVHGNNSTTKLIEISNEDDGQTMFITCKFFEANIVVTYPTPSFKIVLSRIDEYGAKTDIEVDTVCSGNYTFSVNEIGTYEVSAYRVSPYSGIEDSSGDYDNSGEITITSDGQQESIILTYNNIPIFTYSGSYKITDDDGNKISSSFDNWNIYFLSSGRLNVSKLNGAAKGVEAFLVGGGGNGGGTFSTWAGYDYMSGGGGGGGGHCVLQDRVMISPDTKYEITIGEAGGTTSAFGNNASGGSDGGTATNANDVNGGGAGGSGGASGGRGGVTGGSAGNGYDGQYAFLDSSTGVRYGPGGGGGGGYNGAANIYGPNGAGGKDGGGSGGCDATANSGGGGGGGNAYGAVGRGASGIVIIRNRR